MLVRLLLVALVTLIMDYLNIICKNHVYWIDPKWNSETFGKLACDEEDICLIHYNLAAKPWHYEDCKLAKYFWQYAKETTVYDEIKDVLNNFTLEEIITALHISI